MRRPLVCRGACASASKTPGMVCKRLVELMGGVIGVESTVGAGSVFWIELKLAAAQIPLSREVKPTSIADRRTASTGQLHTLLYVEDNLANLMLVEGIIERRPDIRLLSARDGIQGIELARAALPDAIARDIEKGLQAGFFRYLTKPIKVVEFMHTVDEALNFARIRSNSRH